MNKLIDIELPFSGFYESWHDQKCDDVIEQHFTDEETGMDIKPEYQETEAIYMAPVDWSAIHREYAKNYAELFGEELGLTITFDAMQSPREYNFSTDRIFCKVPRAEFDKIRREVEAYAEWPAIIKERFTSRDGFWSHYSNDSTDEEWTKDTLDECQTRVILETYLDKQHENDPLNVPEWHDREWQLVEDMELYGWQSVNDAIDTIEKYHKDNVKKGAKK